MSTIADLIIKVRADTKGAEADLKGLGSKMGSGLGKALIPATAALGVMGVVGKQAFDNLQDGAKNASQTEAVIKSTGDASGVTAKHVDDLAMSLRQKAGVDDDVVHAGENMLLTFTNIRNEAGKGNAVFDSATKTMLDMSHALGQSTTTSALQLGKALNDPIKGMSALQRVGVSFTEAQKKQVAGMVKAGDTMGAQKLILHELNREFGGSAERIDPTTKSLANMKLDAVDLASSLLQGLMPAFRILMGILHSATTFMTEHERATKIVVGVIAALAGVVIAANVAMKLYSAGALVVKAVTGAWTAAQWLLNAALEANPIGLVILALVALGVGLAVLWAKSETFRRIVTTALDDVKGVARGVAHFFTNDVPAAFNHVIGWVRSNWPLIVTLISGPFAPIVALATNAFGVRSALEGAMDSIEGKVRGVFGALAGIVRAAVKGVEAGVHALEGVFHPILTLLDDIEGGASTAAGAIQKVVDIAGKVGGIVGKAKGLLGHVPGFASGVSNFAGGMALVGENGPELVNLPGGSSVFTNGQSRRMLGGAGGIHIENMHVRSDEDVRLWARDVASRLGA